VGPSLDQRGIVQDEDSRNTIPTGATAMSEFLHAIYRVIHQSKQWPE
jgi:hypothetical protein